MTIANKGVLQAPKAGASERARRMGQRFIMMDSFMVVMGFHLVFPMISLHFVDKLAWAAAAVGLALGLRQIAQQGLGLIGGSLADRFGAKPMIVSGMLLRGLGFVVLAVAQHPGVLIISCILSGLGGALFDPSRSALIVKLTRPLARNRFFSFLAMQDSLAGVLGALLGTWLLAFDFFWVAMTGAGFFFVNALLNAWLLPAYRIAAKPAAPWDSMQRVLRDKPYIWLVLTFSGYFMLVVQLMLLVPVTIKQLAGSAQAVGAMYFMDAVLSVCLVYPLARLGERYLRLETRILLGIACLTVSLAAMAWVQHIGLAFVVLALFFIGTLIVEPAREVLFAQYARPEARGSYLGMSRLGLGLGGLTGFIGGGFLQDLAGRLQLPGLPWLALAAVGVLTMFALHRQFTPRLRVGQPLAYCGK